MEKNRYYTKTTKDEMINIIVNKFNELSKEYYDLAYSDSKNEETRTLETYAEIRLNVIMDILYDVEIYDREND